MLTAPARRHGDVNRHFRDASVRYARWDLSRGDLVDPRSGTILAPLCPLDHHANDDGQRLLLKCDTPPGEDPPPAEGQPQAPQPPGHSPLPPLLQQLLTEYSATGLPPAYLPQNAPTDQGEAS